MHDERYATTRRLITEKPACFDNTVDGIATLLKMPDSYQKIAEGGLRLQGFFKEGSEDKPLITVVTVVYNGAEFLEDTIKSVIGQTYDNVEYIIVDGGSTDGTLDIIRKYQHTIDYWVSEPDSGIYGAMNKGIVLGSGDWNNFMNAGDVLAGNNILRNIFQIQRLNFDVIYGDSVVFGDGSCSVQRAKNISYFNLFLWSTRAVCHQSLFVRSKVCPFYDDRLSLKAELKWYFDISRNNVNYFYVQEPICRYLLGGASDQDFEREMKETIGVMISQNPFLVILHAPVFIFKVIRRFLR